MCYRSCKESKPAANHTCFAIGYGQDGPYANRPGYDVMIEVRDSD